MAAVCPFYTWPSLLILNAFISLRAYYKITHITKLSLEEFDRRTLNLSGSQYMSHFKNLSY